MAYVLVTGAGIEPAARALKVRCSTTELPGLSSQYRSSWCERDAQRHVLCTDRLFYAKGTETSVVSHDIATTPPRPAGFLAIANVNCSTGVSSARLLIDRLPEIG